METFKKELDIVEKVSKELGLMLYLGDILQKDKDKYIRVNKEDLLIKLLGTPKLHYLEMGRVGKNKEKALKDTETYLKNNNLTLEPTYTKEEFILVNDELERKIESKEFELQEDTKYNFPYSNLSLFFNEYTKKWETYNKDYFRTAYEIFDGKNYAYELLGVKVK